jgi:tetratricopeptide (TPR) repeat protein
LGNPGFFDMKSLTVSLLLLVSCVAPAAQAEPGSGAELMRQAGTFYRQGQYDETIECLKKLLSEQKDAGPDVLVNLADAYRDRAEFKDAPQMRGGDQTQALEYYSKAVEIDPNFAPAYNHLGIFYFQQNNLPKAEAEINRAIEAKRDYAAAYYNLALVEAKMKKLPQAKRAFEDSLRYETEPAYKEKVRAKLSELGFPSEKTGYQSTSYDLFDREDWPAAEAMLRRAVGGEAAKDPVAHNNLGYALARQGKYAQAIAEYRTALKLQTTDFPAAQYNLGQALRQTGDLDGAEKCLLQASKDAGGNSALIHNALGLVYKQKKNLANAIKEYKLAILQSGDSLPVVHFNLALALEHDPAHKGEAATEYELYLKQAPRGVNASAARSRLPALKKAQ